VPPEPTPRRSPEGLPQPQGLSVPDAARSLLAAVDRAGPRWVFHGRREVRGVDLEGADEVWPVRLAGGALLGIVVQHPGAPHPDDELIRVLLGALQSLVEAERVAAAAERRAVRAERAASVDPMTGLANRRAWREALAREGARVLRHDSSAVVAVVDLDGLKAVNDQHGHLAGDILIQRAATAVRAAVRDTDLVARLGGDEFAVLAVETGEGSSARLATRIRRSLGDAGIEASVGAASAGPDRSLPAALEAADHAMYREKARRDRAGSAPADDDEEPRPPAPVAAGPTPRC